LSKLRAKLDIFGWLYLNRVDLYTVCCSWHLLNKLSLQNEWNFQFVLIITDVFLVAQIFLRPAQLIVSMFFP